MNRGWKLSALPLNLLGGERVWRQRPPVSQAESTPIRPQMCQIRGLTSGRSCRTSRRASRPQSGRPAAAPHGALEQVSPSARPGKAVSHVATALWVSGIRAPWFSKLHVLGARLSGAGLGSWGAWCGVQILCSSETLWLLSSLLTGAGGRWGGGVGVAFMPRLSPSPSHVLPVGLLLGPIYRSCSVFRFFQRKLFFLYL